MKKYESYNDSRNRDKESLYNLLVMNKIIKALKEKYDRQIKTDKAPKIGIRKYIAKWIDPLTIVTIILAYFTYGLFKEATNQSTISKQAADAATNAAFAAIKSDSISIAGYIRDSIRNKEAVFSDSIKFDKQFNLTNKSLSAQIISLKETQKEFEIANRPFIQTGDYKIDSFPNGNFKEIEFDLDNIGKIPAQIIKTSFQMGTGNKPYDEMLKIIETRNFTQTDSFQKPIISNVYGFREHLIFKEPMPENILSAVKNGSGYIYIKGEIFYKNYVTNKPYKVEFINVVILKPFFAIGVIKAEDKEL